MIIYDELVSAIKVPVIASWKLCNSG